MGRSIAVCLPGPGVCGGQVQQVWWPRGFSVGYAMGAFYAIGALTAFASHQLSFSFSDKGLQSQLHSSLAGIGVACATFSNRVLCVAFGTFICLGVPACSSLC